MPVISNVPTSHKLQDVADWYLTKIGSEKHKQILEVAKAVAKENRPLRVGTMCSGTDSPVAVLNGLAHALGNLSVEHTFSCEFDAKKRQWITENFPQLPLLFGDVMELKKGKAMNYITGETAEVPQVDVVIAGFVCKSVSTENNDREKFKNCIKEASGKTGETFDGVMGYVAKFKPSIVICENVKGLTIRNKGEEPVINHVKASFKKVGYAFDYAVLDTRKYLLPQRRNRCWMWAFKGVEHQEAAQQVGQDVKALASEHGYSLDKLFKLAKVSGSIARVLNTRQRRVVKSALRKLKKVDRIKDVIVDVAKSEERGPRCIGATACIVPNSLPYRIKTRSFLTPEQVHCVQGIYKEDFPALARWAKDKASLTRDLAGNAFSTTVCMAVMISALLHAPIKGGSSMASTPRRGSKKLDIDFSPPRTRKRSTEEVMSPSKRSKLSSA